MLAFTNNQTKRFKQMMSWMGIKIEFYLLAGIVMIGGCVPQQYDRPSGFVSAPLDKADCLVVTEPGTFLAASESGDAAVRMVLPTCQPVHSGLSDVFVQISWTRRDNRLVINRSNPRTSRPGPLQKHRPGVLYLLHIRAENVRTRTVIADVYATQFFRHARKPAQEGGLERELAARLADAENQKRLIPNDADATQPGPT